MDTKILVKKISANATAPKFNHDDDAGADLYSAEKLVLEPHKRALVRTDIAVQVMEIKTPLERFIDWLFDNKWKYYFKIEDTSGNAYKKGTRTLAGVVDQSYTGNVGVVLYNTSDVPIEINVGDKIAQMILHKVPWVSSINAVEELQETVRGDKGYGSSGSIGDKK